MDYAISARKAKSLLKKHGVRVKIRTYSYSEYNEEESETETTYIDSYGYGALFDFFFGATNISGTLIEKGDKRLYLDPDTVIKMGTHIFFGLIEYEVVGVREINPAGIVVLYDLHLRL